MLRLISTPACVIQRRLVGTQGPVHTRENRCRAFFAASNYRGIVTHQEQCFVTKIIIVFCENYKFEVKQELCLVLNLFSMSELLMFVHASMQ